MRAFAWFVGVLVAAGLLAALIAYPVYELTSLFAPWPFHRVASRIAMLAAGGRARLAVPATGRRLEARRSATGCRGAGSCTVACCSRA